MVYIQWPCNWGCSLWCFLSIIQLKIKNSIKIETKKKCLLFDFLSSGFPMSFKFLGNLRPAFSASGRMILFIGVCVTHSTWQCNATDLESSCLQDVQLACRNSRKPSACCDLRAAISIYHQPSDNRIVFTWYTCSLGFLLLSVSHRSWEYNLLLTEVLTSDWVIAHSTFQSTASKSIKITLEVKAFATFFLLPQKFVNKGLCSYPIYCLKGTNYFHHN